MSFSLTHLFLPSSHNHHNDSPEQQPLTIMTKTNSITNNNNNHPNNNQQNKRLEEQSAAPSPKKGEVKLKMIAAPISLFDGDLIQGSHPSSSSSSMKVGGVDGVGVVEEVGEGVNLKVGDWVIPNSPAFGTYSSFFSIFAFFSSFSLSILSLSLLTSSPLTGGTWRTHATVSSSLVDSIPSSLPPAYAASLGVTASTAYRLLNDFEKLEKGDVVVQNGGSGLVAQLVVQLAEKKGVKVITILRDRLFFGFYFFHF